MARRRPSRRPKVRRNTRRSEPMTPYRAMRTAQWFALYCVNSAIGFYATRLVGNTLALAMPTHPALAKTLAAGAMVTGTLWSASRGYIPVGAGDIVPSFVTGEFLAAADAYTRGVAVLSGGDR